MKKNLLILIFLFSGFIVCAQKKKTPVAKNDSVKIEIVKLDNAINSEFSDYAPVITADGQQMFFTSRRPFTDKEKKKNKEAKENIYVATLKKDGKWGKAVALPPIVNYPGSHSSNIAISNDGQRLLIYRDYRTGNGDIFECLLKGKEWTAPASLGEPINSEFYETSASISPDGRTIYFVSNRPGGSGGRDIWKCTKSPEGVWGDAKNLGNIINTAEDDEAVYIHPDGKTLYFSSKGHNSKGGYDIYKSEFVKEKWSKPTNLGSPINSINDDFCFVMAANGKTAYYTSASDGTRNIYQVNFISLKKEAAKEPRVTVLKGTVKDAVNQKPIEAIIEIIDNEKGEVISSLNSNSDDGRYLVSLPSGKNYGIRVNAQGYLFHSENIELADTSTYNEVVKNILLNKMETGTKVVLRNIFFDFGKATLRSESIAELNQLKLVLTDNPSIKIEISGHTDNVSSDEYNLKLSESRAKAVVEHLAGLGIPNERLTYKGYGKNQPLAENSSEEGRQINRRVEFKIVSK